MCLNRFLLVCAFAATSVVHCEEGTLMEPRKSGMDTDFLSPVLREHYREAGVEVHLHLWNGNESQKIAPWQGDLVNKMVRSNADWMVVSFGDLQSRNEHRPAYYNVFLVQDYAAFCIGLPGIEYEAYRFDGLYTFVIKQISDLELVGRMMDKLWSLQIMKVVVILEGQDEGGNPVAYSYHPYRAGQCGIVEPRELGQYVNGSWERLREWFADPLANMHRCALNVGAVDINPYSMVRTEGNRTVHFGLEVHIIETLAERLNFTIAYVAPTDNVKWGMLYPTNSTGLVGMLQRREADVGFGSLGYSLNRHTYLRMGIPNKMSQMIMGIPPKRPYTSLEKLFQPFTGDAWLCIGLGYATFGLVTLVLVRLNRRINIAHESLQHHPLYQLWVLLMGGAIGPLRMDSTRVFVVGFILNTLVIRTLYQAGMFQRLQASASLASDLNTLDAINRAGLYYNMFRASLQFYKDNPLIPADRIRLVPNDHQDWDELFYQVSQDRLGGVMVAPRDCLAYYVKRYGKDGVVYVGKDTGFMYNLGFHYPKTTSLLRRFDAWLLRMHSSGLVHHWSEEYEDNRYWTNAKEDPEPASLKWNQISGGFYLCSVLLLLATIVFLGEIVYYRLHTWVGCYGKANPSPKGDRKGK